MSIIGLTCSDIVLACEGRSSHLSVVYFAGDPLVLTALKKGSLYNAAMLGFQLLAVWGAFLLEPKEAFRMANFQLKKRQEIGQ